MKFTCEKHILQAAVNAASRAASARSSIPALEGLLIQAGANVRVTGYDLRKGIYQSFEADVTEPGSAVVMTAKLIGEMMRVLPDGMSPSRSRTAARPPCAAARASTAS